MYRGHDNQYSECDEICYENEVSEGESDHSYDADECDTERQHRYWQRPIAASASMSDLLTRGDQFESITNLQMRYEHASDGRYSTLQEPRSGLSDPDIIESSSEQSMYEHGYAYADVEAMVEDLIDTREVLIFSKTTCPHCNAAKFIFDDLEYPYTVLELDKRNDGEKILEILEYMTDGRSVPRIFINGDFIGGGSDLREMYESGQLEGLLGIG